MTEALQSCVEKSRALQQRLMELGFAKKGHVTGQGAKFINTLARRHGCRPWEYTRDARDYDELLALLDFHAPASIVNRKS